MIRGKCGLVKDFRFEDLCTQMGHISLYSIYRAHTNETWLSHFFNFFLDGTFPPLGAISGVLIPPGIPCLPVLDVLGPIPVLRYPVVFAKADKLARPPNFPR